LLDHFGLKRAHLVGHIAGGFAALRLAIGQPDRVRTPTVVGVAPVWDEPFRQRVRDLLANLEADPGWIDEQVRRHGPTHGEGQWGVLLDALLARAADQEALPFQPMDLAAITRPTLVVHGDRICSIRSSTPSRCTEPSRRLSWPSCRTRTTARIRNTPISSFVSWSTSSLATQPAEDELPPRPPRCEGFGDWRMSQGSRSTCPRYLASRSGHRNTSRLSVIAPREPQSNQFSQTAAPSFNAI
jgi:hypothetical protein